MIGTFEEKFGIRIAFGGSGGGGGLNEANVDDAINRFGNAGQKMGEAVAGLVGGADESLYGKVGREALEGLGAIVGVFGDEASA